MFIIKYSGHSGITHLEASAHRIGSTA
eukprot:SAG31_NODE_35475_length_322_cov_1.439462_1_plen_26_part_10